MRWELGPSEHFHPQFRFFPYDKNVRRMQLQITEFLARAHQERWERERLKIKARGGQRSTIATRWWDRVKGERFILDERALSEEND